MTTKKSTQEKSYYISAKIMLDTNIVINAASLEGALDKARSLQVLDFIDILGDNNDSELNITGVFNAE